MQGSKESEAITAIAADGSILASDGCKSFQFKINLSEAIL
jgi:hypothetical protein